MTDKEQAFKEWFNKFKKTHPILAFILGVIVISFFIPPVIAEMYTGLYKSIWKGTDNDR